jgi:dihydropteroate synthase
MAASYCCEVFCIKEMIDKSSEIKTIQYTCNGKTLTFIKPLVMAIVNITPDSFYDGNKYSDSGDALRDVAEKIRQGADIIDIGAASSRPGAVEIPAEEEWNRLEPVLKVLRNEFRDIFISVDTYRAAIARRSAHLGADIINDISGGALDPDMFKTVAELQLPYILMHMQGNPQNMQQQPAYTNVVKEVADELRIKAGRLAKLGFNKVILDPGFGFGKTPEHNFALLKHLSALRDPGFPLLAGISRKSMINKVIGTNPVTALNGTTVLNTIALMNGCNILRVHDVIEAKQAIELVEFYKKQ